jgi:L-aspartate oxidase
MGVQFDRAGAGDEAHATPDGLLRGREGAHSRWRVLHAGGDATGAEIERALMSALRKRSTIEVYEETFVSSLRMQESRCVGLQALDQTGRSFELEAHTIVLANGGAGGLWLHTSNPSGATADGLALAWGVGAALSDLEFMQFHPTVLVTQGSSHLISEAVRGEGAYLRNHAGERFMPRYSAQEELAPRDVVARAILSEMLAEQTNCQYLDLRHLPSEKMYARFPTIAAICQQYGLNLTTDLLPVAPAAHYCMGGVMVDTYGRTTVPGLYAVGEVACTGVHGANRLASNSLLEGLVYGIRIADHLMGDATESDGQSFRSATLFIHHDNKLSFSMIPSSGRADNHDDQQTRYELRQLMWKYVSLVRDREGLLAAKQQILLMRQKLVLSGNRETLETVNMLQVAELVVAAALERCESRGSHWRSDYQQQDASLAKQHYAFQPSYIDHCGLWQPYEEVVLHV